MTVENDTEPQTAIPAVTLSAAGVLRGARRLFPLAVFTIPFGVAYGVAAIESGLTNGQAIASSAFVFSGAVQFAALDFWGRPGVMVSLGLVVLALNIRLIIMGAALAPWVNPLPLGKRLLAVLFLSDPNFADSQPRFRKGERDAGVILGGGAILWTTWVGGAAVGAYGGAALGDQAAYGVDVVMPCYFAAIVASRMERASTLFAIAAAAATSVGLLEVLPTGWNIVAAALVGACVAAALDARGRHAS